MLWAIYVWGPLLVAATLFIVAGAGLLWSPVGALIAWRLASRQRLDGRRHALLGVAYSVFLLLPWFILVFGLFRRDLTVSATIVSLSTVILYCFWLVGPILFWGHYVANFVTVEYFVGNSSYEFREEPDNWLAIYSLFAMMIVLWIGSSINTMRTWRKHGDVLNINYILPFALAWVCTLVSLGYVLLFPSG